MLNVFESMCVRIRGEERGINVGRKRGVSSSCRIREEEKGEKIIPYLRLIVLRVPLEGLTSGVITPRKGGKVHVI